MKNGLTFISHNVVNMPRCGTHVNKKKRFFEKKS